MLFNSIEFALFIPIIFILYWFVTNKNLKLQNLLLVVSSYFFYGWWDWRFLSLIAFSSIIDYIIGIKLKKENNVTKRKILLIVSIVVNLGFLGFFKYYNFFAQSLADAFTLLGHPLKISTLKIILPVGISFYTFQTLSYSIDVYRKKIEPTKNIVAFFAFVSFFPQLVAGPIERATNLLPQFYQKRVFEYNKAVDGLQQIIWGLFKKIVIADNAAVYANDIFTNYNDYSGSTLFLGAIFFAFQIYGDFSGYSDIAIGTARLFGFNLRKNFAFPYFSRDIAEFWRRWHISLSSWFRDYLYIPLGGSRGGILMKIRNTFAIFIISGFWHGANWTFIIWGFLNALYFLPLLLSKQNRNNLNTVAHNKYLPNYKEIFQIGLTFFITLIAWIFFRADNIEHAFLYIQQMFSHGFFSSPKEFPTEIYYLLTFFIVTEWIHREKEYGLQLNSEKIPIFSKWIIYYVIIFLIVRYGGEPQEFIYFQF